MFLPSCRPVAGAAWAPPICGSSPPSPRKPPLRNRSRRVSPSILRKNEFLIDPSIMRLSFFLSRPLLRVSKTIPTWISTAGTGRNLVPAFACDPVQVIDNFPVSQSQFADQLLIAVHARAILIDKAESAVLDP